MYDRLLTLIRVDLATNEATISVRGRFTTTNYRALVPLIRRARALPGNPTVTVDVSRAATVEADATRLLLEACHSLPPHPNAHIDRHLNPHWVPDLVRVIGTVTPSDTSRVAPPVAA